MAQKKKKKTFKLDLDTVHDKGNKEKRIPNRINNKNRRLENIHDGFVKIRSLLFLFLLHHVVTDGVMTHKMKLQVQSRDAKDYTATCRQINQNKENMKSIQ